MNARDELATELWKHHYEEFTMNPEGTERSLCQCGAPVYPMKSLVQHHAEVAIAAGYRKPRTITTAAERTTLRPGTVAVDDCGNAWKRGFGSWVGTGDLGPLFDYEDITLTVLYEPATDPALSAYSI